MKQLNLPKGAKKERIQDVFFYNIQFIKSETINSKVVRLVQLDLKKKKIRLENSRRFMFGSLVCFTKDNFRNIIFGTIYERKMDLLKKGLIGVETRSHNFEYNVNYIMVECSVYFEPYYQVLKALQMMDVNNFPLEDYIINVETEIMRPEYVEETGIMNDENRDLQLPTRLAIKYWPSAKKLGLDESQYKAFYSALTQEFCVIQGPPGTGKTYIGLRIADILLQNEDAWKTGPLLVVCFTNHALDQFLEGIMKFTKEIVRIGGQSKSELLQQFNIRNIRSKRDFNVSSALRNKRGRLENVLSYIKNLQKRIDLMDSKEFLFDISQFLPFINNTPNNNAYTWFYKCGQEEIFKWLLGGYDLERNQRDVQQVEPIAGTSNNDDNNSDSDESEEFFDAYEDEKERILDDSDDEVVVNKDALRRQDNFILMSLKTFNDEIADIQRKINTLEAEFEEKPNGMYYYLF